MSAFSGMFNENRLQKTTSYNRAEFMVNYLNELASAPPLNANFRTNDDLLLKQQVCERVQAVNNLKEGLQSDRLYSNYIGESQLQQQKNSLQVQQQQYQAQGNQQQNQQQQFQIQQQQQQQQFLQYQKQYQKQEPQQSEKQLLQHQLHELYHNQQACQQFLPHSQAPNTEPNQRGFSEGHYPQQTPISSQLLPPHTAVLYSHLNERRLSEKQSHQSNPSRIYQQSHYGHNFNRTDHVDKGNLSMLDILLSGGSPLPNMEIDMGVPSTSTFHETPPSSPESAIVPSVQEVGANNNSFYSNNFGDNQIFQKNQSCYDQTKSNYHGENFENLKTISYVQTQNAKLKEDYIKHKQDIRNFSSSNSVQNVNFDLYQNSVVKNEHEINNRESCFSNACSMSTFNQNKQVNVPYSNQNEYKKANDSFSSNSMSNIPQNGVFPNDQKRFNYSPLSPVSLKSVSPVQDTPTSSTINQLADMNTYSSTRQFASGDSTNRENQKYCETVPELNFESSPLSSYSEESSESFPLAVDTNNNMQFENLTTTAVKMNAGMPEYFGSKETTNFIGSVEENEKMQTVQVRSKSNRRSRKTKKKSPGKPRLYNFLCEMLHERNPCMEWVDKSSGIFKFLDSSRVAHLWGRRKNKPNMPYENFARSLRTYIKKGFLTKPKNKLVYRFSKLPSGNVLNL